MQTKESISETHGEAIKTMLRDGKSYNEIADELNIAVNSVGNYLKDQIIRSYMEKTGRL